MNRSDDYGVGRELVVSGTDTIDWSDASTPNLSPSDAALVRPVAVGVCDFDRAVINGSLDVLPLPIPLGHEIVGEVIDVGDAVATVAPGTIVLAPMQISCGACGPCRGRRTNSCERVPRLSNFGLGRGGGGFGGGMSDVVVVPYADAMLIPLASVHDAVDHVALGCNLTEAYRCLEPVRTRDSASVLVLGGHGANLGYYTVVLARALGAANVTYLAADDHQLETAAGLGAEAVHVQGRLRPGGYDAVVDVSLDPQLLAIGLAHCAPDGICTMPWFYPHAVPVPLPAMFPNNASLVTGQAHIRGLLDDVVPLVREGVVSTTSIPIDIVDWHLAPTKYGRSSRKQIFVR